MRQTPSFTKVLTLIFLCCSLLSPRHSFCGGTRGATPFNFLFLDPHPRPGGLGGAYGAVQGDIHSLSYNPAGLSTLKRNEASFMHSELVEGISHDYLAMGLKGRNLALSINTVNFGRMGRTTLSNPSGEGLGSFTARDWAMSLGYAKKYKDSDLSLGIAGKYIQERIDTYKAYVVALDMGAILDLESQYQIPAKAGISLQNLGPNVRFDSNREEIPSNIKTSLLLQAHERVRVFLDLNQPKNGDFTLHLGTEYKAFDILALRAGFNGRNDAASGITLGLGLLLPEKGKHSDPLSRKIFFDYAFVSFGDMGSTHRFSISVHWNSLSVKKREKEKAIQPGQVRSEEETPHLSPAMIVLMFPSEKSAINPAHYSSLDRAADFLESNPGYYAKIISYMDSREINETGSNVSLQRAESVMAYLLRKAPGLDASRFIIVKKMEKRSVARHETPKDRAMNRRVEIYFHSTNQ
ncbi:PorV/PorQ family protein [Elusimicrobiota bacterium]